MSQDFSSFGYVTCARACQLIDAALPHELPVRYTRVLFELAAFWHARAGAPAVAQYGFEENPASLWGWSAMPQELSFAFNPAAVWGWYPSERLTLRDPVRVRFRHEVDLVFSKLKWG